jgi:hypothetical protein
LARNGLDAGGSAVGKTTYKEAADLKKSKNLSLSTLRYRVVSFSENSNVPTSEGKALMETYFKHSHSYPSSLSNQDRMHLSSTT